MLRDKLKETVSHITGSCMQESAFLLNLWNLDVFVWFQLSKNVMMTKIHVSIIQHVSISETIINASVQGVLQENIVNMVSFTSLFNFICY